MKMFGELNLFWVALKKDDADFNAEHDFHY